VSFKRLFVTSLLATSAMHGLPSFALTAIVRDGTLGAGPTTALIAGGTPTVYLPAGAPIGVFPRTFNTFSIPESYGVRSGANVFQSFGTFNVGAGDAAVFTVGAPTNNVIARVTGGTSSSIGGLLKLDPGGFGGAGNLFLINPAGLVISGGAVVDVPGTASFSTAPYLRFPDGVFYADGAKASTLSAAAPTAFGFLGSSRASVITGDTSGCLSTNCLTIPGSVSLVGGDVTSGLNLSSPGNIRVAAVGQDVVEVPTSGALPVLHGTVSVSRTLESTSSTSGTELSISGGDINLPALQGGSIRASYADINVTAANNITIDGTLVAGRLGSFSGILGTNPLGSNVAGNVNVTAGGTISLLHGGSISAQTYSDSQSGNVRVRAGDIYMDGSLYDKTGIYSQSGGLGPPSTNLGGTGLVDVAVTGNITITNGAQISNSTNSKGSSGNILVSAKNFSADGADPHGTNDLRDYVGITSVSRPNSSGTANAGNVSVTIEDTLSLLNGARISSTTYSSGGAAGNVTVKAGSVKVDGAFVATASDIARWTVVNTSNNNAANNPRYDGSASSIQAAARAGSSGQTGNVSITATKEILFSNGGEASIQNNATLAGPALALIVPTTLTVTAPNIKLQDATITAASTGNVPASNIRINFDRLLQIDPSVISTSSNLGNGGSILISGTSGSLFLDNSQITTSVAGLSGNGGDISIQANAMVMNSGFIQANTAAPLALGGNVAIGVNSLITSGNSLFLGGSTPYTPQPFVFGFNVIQAASPTGVSGAIQLTSPVVDVARSVTGVTAKAMDAGGLARSPCRITGGSSLAQAGRGGLPRSASDLLVPSWSGLPAATESTGLNGSAVTRVSDLHPPLSGKCT